MSIELVVVVVMMRMEERKD